MSEMRAQAVQIINEIPEEKIIYVIDILKSIKGLYNDQTVQKEQRKKVEARTNLMKYQGRLPEDFDYREELLEALDEKYTSFN